MAPYERADGTIYCTACALARPSSDFCASAMRRRLHTCARCTNKQRTEARRRNRASALAITIRQREQRRNSSVTLTKGQVAALLRASRGRSTWQDGVGGDELPLTIDRIALSEPLSIENAIVLTTTQVRARCRATADTLPALERTVAVAIARACAALAE